MRIHEDPIVVPQPPYVSKPSPITDSSNRQPLSLDKRMGAKLPPKAPSFSRNGSMSSHFLSEFDVNDCHDVRSIPDPPTPQPRNRRRLSSPMPRSSSNPRPERFPSSATDSASNLDKRAKPSNKRSRKSLCHVPSPATIEQRDDPSLPSLPSPPNPPKTLHVSICVAEDDSKAPQFMEGSSRSKRRKKRQSMELPREMVQEHARSIADEFSPPRASIPNFSQHDHTCVGDLHNMRELQRLVRGYCKLPKNQRPISEEAQSIEATTTYPMTLPILNHHPLSHANRRAVLQKMGPIIEEIDIRKGQDISKWEAGTGCRVERSKSGKYRYYSIASNAKVSSAEYQRRYMDVLSREAPDRLARATEWKSRLVPLNAPLPAIEPIPFHGRGSSPSAIGDSSSDMDEADNSFAVTQELDLDLNAILALNATASLEIKAESVPSPAKPAQQGEVSMEICDISASVDLGEAAIVSVGSELSGSTDSESNAMTIEPLSEEKPVGIISAVDQSENNIAKEDSGSNVYKEQVECETKDSQMLPFPDRESGSTDPDIARAEKKLWDRIDTALADYSREVMRIVNSKRVATAQTLGAH